MAAFERLKEGWLRNKEFWFDFGKNGAKQTLSGKAFWIVIITALNLLYIELTVLFLKWYLDAKIFKASVYTGWQMLFEYFKKVDFYESLGKLIVTELPIAILFAVILAPLWEEVVFRTHWFKKLLRKSDKEELFSPDVISKLGKLPVWQTAVFTSILFGLMHGGPINLLLQGVSGLFLSFIYFRNNRSYWSCVFAHALYNGAILIFVYSGLAKDSLAALTLPLFWVNL